MTLSNGTDATSPPRSRSHARLCLSEVPTDEELFFARIFEEPLVPIGGESDVEERRALGNVLHAWLSAHDSFDVASLECFLHERPTSPWSASLALNLGLVALRTGRLQRCLEALEKAWTLSMNAETARGRAIAERAVSELALLDSRLGRKEHLEKLLHEIGRRVLRGSANERVVHAWSALSVMQNDSGMAFLCGAVSLGRVFCALGVDDARHDSLAAVRSTLHGMSLQQLWQLAEAADVPMRRAWRAAGTKVPSVAVVHCKIGHFVALTRTIDRDAKDAVFMLEDPAFHEETWVGQTVLDEESSGYILIPSELPTETGWREVGDTEAATVWGRGYTSLRDLIYYGDEDLMGTACGGGPGGLARYDFHGFLAGLHVEDTPVWIRAPFGRSLTFKIAYNQADAFQDSSARGTSLGHKWTFNWRQFLVVRPEGGNPGSAVSMVYLFKGGGGIARYFFWGASDTSTSEPRDQSSLTRQLDRNGDLYYRLQRRDGTVEVYGTHDGAMRPTYYLTEYTDPQRNTVRLEYDDYCRLTTITDAFGQEMRFNYRGNGFLILSVTVYGRDGSPQGTANFEYDSAGRLTRITDMANIASSFGYVEARRGIDGGTEFDRNEDDLFDSPFPIMAGAFPLPDPDFLRWMRTPYGITTFQTGWGTDLSQAFTRRWIEATAPNGDTQRVEFRHDGAELPDGRRFISESDPLDPAPESIVESFRRADPCRDC